MWNNAEGALLAKYTISSVALVQALSDQQHYATTKFFKVAVDGVETVYKKGTRSIRVNMHPNLHIYLEKYLGSMAKQHQEHREHERTGKRAFGLANNFIQKYGCLILDLTQSWPTKITPSYVYINILTTTPSFRQTVWSYSSSARCV